MLIEIAIWTSCSVTGVALGGCQPACPAEGDGSFTICEVLQDIGIEHSTYVTPQPLRLCSYYVNGTIDIPTSTQITAWVEIGSRLCIGDVIEPLPDPKPRTLVSEFLDVFTAYAVRPFAFVAPDGEVQIEEVARFTVLPGGGTHQGKLFENDVEVRFRPHIYSWSFSNGAVASGASVSRSFSRPDQIQAFATVEYIVDYRRVGGSWVIAAAKLSIRSNELGLSVIDPPRRTLLRD